MTAFLNLGTPEIILLLFVFALPLVMIISVLNNPNFNVTAKLLWIIISIFAPVLGVIIYFAWGRNQKSGV